MNITGVGTGADSYDLTVADGATVVLATVGANDAISITSAGGDLDLTGVAALEDLTITSASDLDVAVTTALAADTVVDTSANVTISGIAADLDDDGVTTSGSGTVTIEVTDDANAEDFKGSVVDIIEFSGAQTAGEFIINENAIANFSGSGSAEITIDNVDGDLDTNSTTGTLMVNVSNDMTLIQTGAEVDTLLIQATPDETTDTDSDENGTADTQITITTLETASSTFTETVVVQGSADLEITTWTNDATSSVLSASTMTGDLTIGTTSAAGTIIAGKGDDDITVGNVATTIEGRDGDDTLTGGTAADTIKGGAGDDTIAGGATAANTIDAGAGDDQVTATAADSITLGSGSDTVISAVDIDYTIADIDTTNDTIIVTGTAGGDVDLTDVTPTSGAYDIDGSATDEFTLTGSTATDISAFVQLGTSTAVFTANTAGAVVAGAKDDVIAVDGANTITTGAGNDAIIVATGETTATVDDFTTGSDVVVLLGAAADGDSIDLSSVTPASGKYTVSTNHAITLETGGTALTATDVTGIFQLGSSSVTFDLDNTSNAVGGISAEGGMLDDYVDLGTIGTTATVYNFSDDGGVDYISGIVANTALSEVSFTGLTGITGTGTAVAANASKIADAADGSVYVFADSTDGTGSEAITSFVVGKDDTGAADSSVTADTILADVAAFLDAALGSADGETYVAVINDTGAADANEAYAYLVTADADGIDADNIELIGVLNTTVGNAAVTATDIS